MVSLRLQPPGNGRACARAGMLVHGGKA